MKDEIKQYSKIVKLNADSNPLDWWKIYESAYPTLAKLAKNTCVFVHLNGYLALPDMLDLRKEVYLSQIN